MSVIKFATDNQVPGHDNYPQLEPNLLSAPRTGQVYAQLPAKDDIKILYQGQFVHYDMVQKEVNLTGSGDGWVLVFNEDKLYETNKKMHRDFALKASDSSDGKIYTRVFALVPGDIFTTNAFVDGETVVVGDEVTPDDATGLLKKGASTTKLKMKAILETSLPDGSPAIKIQVLDN